MAASRCGTGWHQLAFYQAVDDRWDEQQIPQPEACVLGERNASLRSIALFKPLSVVNLSVIANAKMHRWFQTDSSNGAGSSISLINEKFDLPGFQNLSML